MAAAVLLWCEPGLRLGRRAACIGKWLVLGKGWLERGPWEAVVLPEPQGRV